MISLEQVRHLDIRVKKAVAALKTLSAENAALKQRIGELQNEEAARAADEEQLEVSLQGVLDVLDEVDEETSELIADDPLGEVMNGEDDLRGALEHTAAEHDEAEGPAGGESPADEAGAEGHRAADEAGREGQQAGHRTAAEAGLEEHRAADEAGREGQQAGHRAAAEAGREEHREADEAGREGQQAGHRGAAEAGREEHREADEAGAEGNRAGHRAAEAGREGQQAAAEAGREEHREADEAAGRRDEPGGALDSGPGAQPPVLLGEDLPPDPGIEALSSESAGDENESAAQEVTPDKAPEDESPDNADEGNPGQAEFDIF